MAASSSSVINDVRRIRQHHVKAVGRKGQHFILQRQPPILGLRDSCDDGQWPVAVAGQRGALPQSSRQFGELVTHTAGESHSCAPCSNL